MATLKERRKALKLTQAEIAERLGIHPLTWARWEKRPATRVALLFEPDCPAWLEKMLAELEAKSARYPDIRTNV